LITGRVSFLFTAFRPVLGTIQPPLQRVQDVMLLGRDSDQSHSHSVKVKKVCHYTSAPTYCHSMVLGKTFPLLYFTCNVIILQIDIHKSIISGTGVAIYTTVVVAQCNGR
jgi:hypothetical protein